MQKPKLADTQPNRARTSKGTQLPSPPAKKKPALPGRAVRSLALVVLFILVIAFSAALGGWAGYASGKSSRQVLSGSQLELSLKDQFELGVQDFEAGRLEVAKQRFEYIVSQDPNFPGITEKLVDVMEILYTTATPTPLAATVTPTPTLDPRPLQDLFNQSLSLAAEGNWSTLLETLSALRKADRTYQVARVDGLMFIALRSRGMDKIIKEGNLGGGSYDLALAEKFGPLDVEASNAREWARLYMIGLSFWEVYPDQAVFYLSQVAAAAPNLQDGSGFTAIERYRTALIQYGDALAAKEAWCDAQIQYELALSIRADAAVQQAAEEAALRCQGVSETPLVTGTATPTLTVTPVPWLDTATPTQPAALPSETPTQSLPTQPPSTPTPQPDIATPTVPAPVETQPPLPSETPGDTGFEELAPTLTPADIGFQQPGLDAPHHCPPGWQQSTPYTIPFFPTWNMSYESTLY